jgi:hypothetical protein
MVPKGDVEFFGHGTLIGFAYFQLIKIALSLGESLRAVARFLSLLIARLIMR